MIKPTIHLNGTSANALLDQYTTAGDAVRLALEALGNAAPNGRDYYPQGPAAFEQARKEHDARTAKLREVLVDLGELAEHVADQE